MQRCRLHANETQTHASWRHLKDILTFSIWTLRRRNKWFRPLRSSQENQTQRWWRRPQTVHRMDEGIWIHLILLTFYSFKIDFKNISIISSVWVSWAQLSIQLFLSFFQPLLPIVFQPASFPSFYHWKQFPYFVSWWITHNVRLPVQIVRVRTASSSNLFFLLSKFNDPHSFFISFLSSSSPHLPPFLCRDLL